MKNDILAKAEYCLKQDVMKNLSTLKYMALYREIATIDFVGDNSNWALLVQIPTHILSYDSATYPEANIAVFLNGNSSELKNELITSLPGNNYILRLNETFNLSVLENRFKIEKGNSFISYTSSPIEPCEQSNGIAAHETITEEALNLIMRNGYSEKELIKYFHHGARWFGFERDKKLLSVCFVYQNYDTIWEIAGVHTKEDERHKGYGRKVVEAALRYLLVNHCIPRYEVHPKNSNSLRLVESLNMKRFLTIQHFLLKPVP